MPASSQTSSQRFLSVDVLRGLTITLMIVVNNPGDEAHVWWPILSFRHFYTLSDAPSCFRRLVAWQEELTVNTLRFTLSGAALAFLCSAGCLP